MDGYHPFAVARYGDNPRPVKALFDQQRVFGMRRPQREERVVRDSFGRTLSC